MSKNRSFHPRLIIVDHFDKIKNQIDVKTELLLQQKHKDKRLNEENINILNEVRQSQIYKVEKIQEKNLSHLENDEIKNKQKWSNIIDDAQLTIEEKIEILKGDLIINDCLLIEDNASASSVSIWITGWFFDRENLGLLK
jgi:hypothetical protein